MDEKEKQKLLLSLGEIEYIIFLLTTAQHKKLRELAIEKEKIISRLLKNDELELKEKRKKYLAKRYLQSKNKNNVQ